MGVNPDVPYSVDDKEEREEVFRALRRVQHALEEPDTILKDYEIEEATRQTKAGDTGTVTVSVELEGDPADLR